MRLMNKIVYLFIVGYFEAKNDFDQVIHDLGEYS